MFLNEAIVAILDQRGKVVGTGFVVHENLIATCAHVINKARSGTVEEHIPIRFYNTTSVTTANIVDEWWPEPQAEDVAILQINQPLPEGALVAPLGSSDGTPGHEFKTFGFPKALSHNGGWGYGQIGDKTIHNGFTSIQLRTSETTVGFSGAPVLNLNTKRIIGMISSITRGFYQLASQNNWS